MHNIARGGGRSCDALMGRRITTRAPTRIDFGGGWTDVPPYTTEEGGFVCNVAIARYATATIEQHDGSSSSVAAELLPGAPVRTDTALAEAAMRRARLEGVTMTLENDFPLGAGLGGSSAAGVAVVGAIARWSERGEDPDALAEESRAIEVEELGVPGGRQDHYAAAYGGALALEFTDRPTVRRIALSPAAIDAIAERCTVVYTGQSRISGSTITAVLDAYRAREKRVLAALRRMKALAHEMATALEGEDLDQLGRLVGEHWEHQRALHPSISTSGIEMVLERARSAGALGGKALGASGGGCVVVIAPADRAEEVRRAVTAVAEHVPARVDHDGFCVVRAEE